VLGQGRDKALSSLIPIVALLMVLSPASGVLFEISMAAVYGTSATVDAFRVAFLVIGLGSQLFLGIVLPNALIPTLAKSRADGRGAEGLAVAVSVVVIVGLLAVPLVAMALLAPGAVVDLLGPGLTAAARAEAVVMVRMFSLVFLAMVLLGGINCVLNVNRVFGLVHVNQIMVNLLAIAAVLALGRQFGGWALSLGILSGALVGLAIGLVQVRQVVPHGGLAVRGGLFRRDLVPEYRRIIALVIPLLVLVLAGQWQIAILNRVLSELPASALATFGYGFKLTAMVGILPMALSTVVFPSLSEFWGGEDHGKARRLATRSVTFTLLVILPIVVLLSLSARDVVGVLLQHGALTDGDADAIAVVFLILLWSGLAAAVNALLMKISYAAEDGYGPLLQALALAAAATVLAPTLARVWGIEGVAISLTAAHAVLTAAYFIYLQVRFKAFDVGYLAGVALRILVAAGVAAALTAAFSAGVGDLFGTGFWGRLGRLVALAAVYLPTYAAVAHLLKVSELNTLISQLLGRIWRVPGNGS